MCGGFAVSCRIGWLISHSHDYIDETECIYIRARTAPRVSDWVQYLENKKLPSSTLSTLSSWFFHLFLSFSPSFLSSPRYLTNKFNIRALTEIVTCIRFYSAHKLKSEKRERDFVLPLTQIPYELSDSISVILYSSYPFDKYGSDYTICLISSNVIDLEP